MYHDAILINVHAKDLRPVEWTMQWHNGTGCLYCGSAVMLPEGGAQAQCTDEDELLKCTRNLLYYLCYFAVKTMKG